MARSAIGWQDEQLMGATYLAVAAAVGAAVLFVVFVTVVQRWRLARRFARRLSPYERRQAVRGQVLDPEEWTRR